MPLPDCRFDLREVVPFIEAQVLGVLERRPGSPDGEAVQRDRRRFHVVLVGAGHHDGQRDAALIGQRVPLRPELAAIRRIGACLRLSTGAFTIKLSSVLPAPLDPSEVVVPGQQCTPQPLEDAGFDPCLEATVACGAGPIFPG